MTLSTTDQALLANSECDLICLDVFIAVTKYRVILVYRPPNSSYEKSELIPGVSFLRDLLYNLTNVNAATVILGDFNLPYINWSNNHARNDGVHNILLECFLNLDLLNLCMSQAELIPIIFLIL